MARGRGRGGCRRTAPPRLRVPGADPDAVGDGRRQRAPPAQAQGARRGCADARDRGARARRARGLCGELSARALGRHEDAHLDRALVTEPGVLLMDEPFAALDEITRFRLNDDLLALWQSLRKTVVFVTHSVFESVYLSQRIVVMTPRPGRVFTELVVDAPHPRDQRFRTSAEYAGYCRLVSEALAEASAAGEGP